MPDWDEQQALSGVSYGPTLAEIRHKREYEERCQRIREYYKEQEELERQKQELERQKQALQTRIDEEGDQGSGAGCAMMGGRRRRRTKRRSRKSKSRRR